MPNIETHAAAGVGSSYVIGLLLKLNPDYLVMALVGSLISAGKQPPKANDLPRWRQLLMASSNISGAGLLGYGGTMLLMYWLKLDAGIGLAIAALLGYFGTHITNAITSTLARVPTVFEKRYGRNGNDDAG